MVLWWIYLLKKWFCGGFTFKKNGFVVDLPLKKRALPTCDWVKENFEEVGKSVFTNSLKKYYAEQDYMKRALNRSVYFSEDSRKSMRDGNVNVHSQYNMTHIKSVHAAICINN